MALGDVWSILRNPTSPGDWFRDVAFDASIGLWAAAGGQVSPGRARIWSASPSDLTAWTLRHDTVGASLLGIDASGVGEMIAVGFNGQIIRSTNGTTWVGTTLGVIEYDKVAYGAVLSPSQNLFLLNGPDRIVQQDSPGVNTWSLVTTATGLTDLQDLDVDSGSALWVAVGGTNGGGPAEVAYRSGGTGGAYTRYTVTGEKLWSIGFGNGVWIGGADAGTIYRAVDPTAGAGAWSQISTPSANRINDVAHLAGDKWVGVASGGDIVFSEDNGVSWESRTSPTAGILAGVAFDASNQQIVAVGEDGLVIGSGTEDPPLIVVPTPDPLIPAKDDYAEEAVGRLISLFRS